MARQQTEVGCARRADATHWRDGYRPGIEGGSHTVFDVLRPRVIVQIVLFEVVGQDERGEVALWVGIDQEHAVLFRNHPADVVAGGGLADAALVVEKHESLRHGMLAQIPSVFFTL
jgi:hypothetical protein